MCQTYLLSVPTAKAGGLQIGGLNRRLSINVEQALASWGSDG